MTATIPLSPADHLVLAAVVRERWPEAARVHGVDPERWDVDLLGDRLGRLLIEIGPPNAAGAVSHLAETLEDLGYAVAWEGGVRVTGWAAVPARNGDPFVRWLAGAPVYRIMDLDPWDPRRRAHDDDLARARAARRGPGPAEDAKRVGAVERWRATYGGAKR